MFYNDDEFNKNEKNMPGFFENFNQVKSYGNKGINKKSNADRIQNITKSMTIIWIFILILIISISIVILFKKNIFATDIKQVFSQIEYEKNNNAINLTEIITQNTGILTKKELVKETRNIEYEIIKEETEQLPKGEEEIAQAGVVGIEDVSAIKTFANEEFIEEEILERERLLEPISQIVKVGTSEFLSINKVHLNDTLYVTSNVALMKNAEKNSASICEIAKSMDVTLLEMNGEFCKVQYKENIGFIKCSDLTSEYSTPSILEENRKEKLKETLKEDIDLNQKSGLTLDDFKKVLSANEKDEYAIIESNAETFYYVEQNYNINGIFLAAVAIEESNWATSTDTLEKYNLFNYIDDSEKEDKVLYIFRNYAEGINVVGKVLKKQYLNPIGTQLPFAEYATGEYYNGSTISAVGVKYSTNKNWSAKIYEHMKYLYEKL